MRLPSPSARRLTLALAGLALATGSLSACGGDSDSAADSADSSAGSAPTSASGGASDAVPTTLPSASAVPADTQALCDVYASFVPQFAALSDPTAPIGALVKRFAAALAEVDPPADMSQQARQGLALSVKEARKLDDDATATSLQQDGASYSADEQQEAQALSLYVGRSCPDLAAGAQPTATPS